MLEDLRGVRSRALALMAVLALALGATACGSDDDSGSDAQAGDAAGDSPKQQISDDYDKFIDDIYEGRYAQACKGYSDAYAKKYPKQVKIADTCVKTMQSEFKTVSVQPRPWIARVIVKGPGRAVAFTKVRRDDYGNPLKVVKVDGTWKFDGPAPNELPSNKQG